MADQKTPFLDSTQEKSNSLKEDSHEDVLEKPSINMKQNSDNIDESFLKHITSLHKRRRMSWHKRNFSPIKFGSMRLSILIWIRMNFGIVIVVPFYFTYFGALGGIIGLIIGYFVTYKACSFIIESSDFTNINAYFPLVKNLLPRFLVPIVKLSLTMDYFGAFIYGGAFTWIAIEYYLLLFNLMPTEWIIDKNKQQFREYSLGLVLIRAGCFIAIFFLLVPLFLRKTMKSLMTVSLISLGIAAIQSVWILIESPFFRNFYSQENQLMVEYLVKPPNIQWISGLFNMALFYYVQPYCLFLRKDLLVPSADRSKKVAALGMLFQFAFYTLFGFVVYVCFGENFLPINITLRLSYSGKNFISELGFQVLLAISSIIGIFGMANYNPGIRDFLMQFLTIFTKRKKFVISSLAPLGISLLIVMFLPSILNIMGFYSLLVCNLNGYIVPTLMKIEILKRTKGSFLTIVGLYMWVTTLVTFGIFGFLRS